MEGHFKQGELSKAHSIGTSSAKAMKLALLGFTSMIIIVIINTDHDINDNPWYYDIS